MDGVFSLCSPELDNSFSPNLIIRNTQKEAFKKRRTSVVMLISCCGANVKIAPAITFSACRSQRHYVFICRSKLLLLLSSPLGVELV